MSMNKQTFKCYIKTLSPIHVECDEVYEPTGFVMDEASVDTEDRITYLPKELDND